MLASSSRDGCVRYGSGRRGNTLVRRRCRRSHDSGDRGLFWIPDLITARIGDLVRYQARVLKCTTRTGIPRALADSSGYRRDCRADSPQRSDLRFLESAGVHFFADRPNPTRFYRCRLPSPREFQAEIIRTLSGRSPG